MKLHVTKFTKIPKYLCMKDYVRYFLNMPNDGMNNAYYYMLQRKIIFENNFSMATTDIIEKTKNA